MAEKETIIMLASSSPRRSELLTQIGVRYEILHVDIDESVGAGESATEYVVRMSLEKARRGYQAAEQRHNTIGADTCIECDGEVLGKAANILFIRP